MNELNGKSVSKAAGWSLLTEIALKLVSPITNMIMARLLMPSAFGLVATITIVTGFAEVLTDAGFQKYMIQHQFDSEEAFEKSFCVSFFSNTAFSVIVVAFIFLFRNRIAILVGAPELNNAIATASVSILFNAYSSIQIAAYKRFFDFKALFKIRVILVFLPLITTVPLAFYLKSYWALVIGGLIASLVQLLIFIIRPKVKIRWYYSLRVFREMFSFSFWTLLEAVTIWLTTNVDLFIVGRLLNEYYLGIYKTSMSTVYGYMNIVSAAVIPVLFSTLSRYQFDELQFKNTFFRFQKITSLFLIPMGLGLYLFKELATLILLGKNWSEASGFIGMYSVAVAFQIVICHFASEVFRSKGKPKLSMLYQWIFILILIPSVIAASKIGFDSLCFVRSAVSAAFICLALVFLQVKFKIQVTEIIKNLFPQIASSVVMFIFGLLLKPYFQGVLLQLILIVLCVLIYFAILILFKSTRAMLSELKTIKNETNTGASNENVQ